MNENTKKAGAIILMVLAVVVAGASALQFFGGSDEKMRVEKTIAMPPGFKSEKQQAIEAQEQAAKGAVAPAADANANAPTERDLVGDIVAGGRAGN